MHSIQFLEPCRELRPYIRYFVERKASLTAASIVHPMPARSFHVIEFLFRDRYTVRTPGTGQSYQAHRNVIVGLQSSRRVELVVHGDIDGFSIFFYGHALKQLLPVAVAEMTNAEFDTGAVTDAILEPLAARLGECRTAQDRVTVANEFFCKLAAQVNGTRGLVAVANAIRLRQGCCRMDTLARQAGMSPRQFERSFRDQVGLGPKLYSRIIRFESALESRSASGGASWVSIAHQLGYHDQMHMVHDFRKLASGAPQAVFQELQDVLTPQP